MLSMLSVPLYMLFDTYRLSIISSKHGVLYIDIEKSVLRKCLCLAANSRYHPKYHQLQHDCYRRPLTGEVKVGPSRIPSVCLTLNVSIMSSSCGSVIRSRRLCRMFTTPDRRSTVSPVPPLSLLAAANVQAQKKSSGFMAENNEKATS